MVQPQGSSFNPEAPAEQCSPSATGPAWACSGCCLYCQMRIYVRWLQLHDTSLNLEASFTSEAPAKQCSLPATAPTWAGSGCCLYCQMRIYVPLVAARKVPASSRSQLHIRSSCRAAQPFPQQVQLGLVQGAVCTVRCGSTSHWLQPQGPASI